jgi:hypothetical protein
MVQMADGVNHTDTSPSQGPGTSWQILGELTLPAGSNAGESIHAWLTEILNPLHLPMGMMEKILRSAQETAGRIAQPEAKLEHIHFLVFAPVHHTSKGQTWGFFRIEKIEQANPFTDAPDHAIEFYLYLEG